MKMACMPHAGLGPWRLTVPSQMPWREHQHRLPPALGTSPRIGGIWTQMPHAENGSRAQRRLLRPPSIRAVHNVR